MSVSGDEKLRIEFPVHRVFDLIYENKWKQVKRTIFFNKSIAAKYAGCSKSKFNGNHSILHYACQFRPPIDVIKALYKAYPNAVFERDCKERCTLHIACKYGCDPEVVEFLLEKNPEAASHFDVKGRTPLILAYKHYVFESRREWYNANNKLVEVAEILTEAAPFVITEEDNQGWTALEYGIEKEYRTRTLLVLQKAVFDYHSSDSRTQDLEIRKEELFWLHILDHKLE